MKTTTFIFAIMLSLGLVSACRIESAVAGSGVRKTEKRDLPPFKAIDMQGAFKIDATAQKPQGFEIEGDDNLLPLVLSEVREGVLYLKTEKRFNSAKGIAVRITVPNLESIKTTGAAEVSIQDLKNDKFEVNSTGASTVSASGQSKSVEIHGTGAGAIDTHRLHADTAIVSSLGAAKIDVYAAEQLDVNVSGASEVSYSGDPKIVNKKVMGAATVSRNAPTAN